MPTGETETIIAYKSKVLSDESINPPTTLGNRFAPKLKQIYNSKIAVEPNGNCLKQDKAFFIHRHVVNLLIVYQLDTFSRDVNTKFVPRNCLFGVIKLTKNILIIMDIVVMVLDFMLVLNLNREQ